MSSFFLRCWGRRAHPELQKIGKWFLHVWNLCTTTLATSLKRSCRGKNQIQKRGSETQKKIENRWKLQFEGQLGWKRRKAEYFPPLLGRPADLVRVARLQNEVGTNYFFPGMNFLTKNAPKFSPNILSLYLARPKRSRKFQPNFPQYFPAKYQKKSLTSFCRRSGRRSSPPMGRPAGLVLKTIQVIPQA